MSEVLSKVKAAANPKTAAAQVSRGAKLVAARDQLIKLGMLSMTGSEVSLTSKGEELMTDKGLTDDTGSLTPEGEKFAYGKEGAGAERSDAEFGALEGFDLLRSIARPSDSE
jgi:hypothetical protein